MARIQTMEGQRTMRMDPARGGSVDMIRTRGADPGSQGAGKLSSGSLARWSMKNALVRESKKAFLGNYSLNFCFTNS